MKYLILILITFNVFADVKVEISNIDGQAFGAKFKTQQLADEWKADNIANDSWGKKETWVRFEVQDNCLELRDVLDQLEEVMFQECKLAVEYTIVETDITVEVNAKKAKKDKDNLDMSNIDVKLLDGTAKLDDVIIMLKLMRGL